VASLHDDDIWEPRFLERTVPLLLANREVDIAFTDLWLIDSDGIRDLAMSADDGQRSGRAWLPAGHLALSIDEKIALTAGHWAGRMLVAAVLRRSAISELTYPDGLDDIFDLWMAYQLAKSDAGFFYVSEKLANYRVHAGTQTVAGFEGVEDLAYSLMIDENRHRPVVEELHRRWAHLRWGRAGRNTSDVGSRAHSQRQLREAVPYLPGHRRVAASIVSRSSVAWHGLRSVRHVRDRLGRNSRRAA
jgi:hypothetical protein